LLSKRRRFRIIAFAGVGTGPESLALRTGKMGETSL